jgi:hypothetical protein
MKSRTVVLVAVPSILLGVGLGVAMQPGKGDVPRPQIVHRAIDTHTLSRFLDCYCHDLSIHKDAIAGYTTCELQVVRPNGKVQGLWRAEKFERDEDGSFRIVVMLKPSDRSKSFNTASDLDIYCNGMTRSLDNPFRELLKEKGIAIEKSGKLTDGQLKLFEWDGKAEADPKVVIRLAFN